MIEHLVLAERRVEASVEQTVHEAVRQLGAAIQLDPALVELRHNRVAREDRELRDQVQEVVMQMVERHDDQRIDVVLLDAPGDGAISLVHASDFGRILLLWLREDLRRVRHAVSERDTGIVAGIGRADAVGRDSGHGSSPDEVGPSVAAFRVAIALAIKAY